MITVDEQLTGLRAVRLGADLWDFIDWHDSRSWNMHRDSTRDAIALASRIHSLNAEYDHHGDELALKRDLLALIPSDAAVDPRVTT